MALPRLKLPPRPRPLGMRPVKPPTFKPYKPPRSFAKPVRFKPPSYFANQRPQGQPQLGPGTEQGVQDVINQGYLNWEDVADLGYQPPPKVGGGGGGGLIGGDWEVQLAESEMGSQMARARGGFQARLRQALIDLGIGDTSKLGSLGQYIDPDTIKAAISNKYSANARITQQAERSRATNNAALAARGILSSGQTTKSQQDVSAGAESDRMSALREFLSGGAEGLGSLADLEAQLAGNVARARGSAAMRAAETYPEAFSEGEPPPFVPRGGGGYTSTPKNWRGRPIQRPAKPVKKPIKKPHRRR